MKLQIAFKFTENCLLEPNSYKKSKKKQFEYKVDFYLDLARFSVLNKG